MALRSRLTTIWLALVLFLLGDWGVDAFPIERAKRRPRHLNVLAEEKTTVTHQTQSVVLPLLEDSCWSRDDKSKLYAECCKICAEFATKTTLETSASERWKWSCTAPAFGDDSSIELVDVSYSDGKEAIERLELVVNGIDKRDFIWICSQFYESRQMLPMIDSANLRATIALHHNQLPADPGQKASLSSWKHDHRYKTILPQESLQQLRTKGYVVVDPGSKENASDLYTAADVQENLSTYLQMIDTGQGASVRSDQVHFMSRSDAKKCSVATQYDLLLGLAAYLNDEMDLSSSSGTQEDALLSSDQQPPIAPATTADPLTVPSAVQYAEYGKNDFYKAHSDNSLTGRYSETNHAIRSNFRAYTCILYLNDNDWDMARDGGALRLYPDSHLVSPDDAATSTTTTDSSSASTDIGPLNGRLLIFESTLIHAVRPVNTDKVRRALTLWINRPRGVPGDVRGEVFF